MNDSAILAQSGAPLLEDPPARDTIWEHILLKFGVLGFAVTCVAVLVILYLFMKALRADNSRKNAAFGHLILIVLGVLCSINLAYFFWDIMRVCATVGVSGGSGGGPPDPYEIATRVSFRLYVTALIAGFTLVLYLILRIKYYRLVRAEGAAQPAGAGDESKNQA